jgi:molybdopterin-guanine dinucleotide biosynthesis protein
MIVAVAGRGRKSGKTAFVCELIRRFAEMHWTAVKLTPHGHGRPGEVVWDEAAEEGDSARYRAAGARQAFWVRAPEGRLDGVIAELRRLAPQGALVVESNRAAERLQPDVLVFIEGAGEKAGAPRLRERADFVVETEADWAGIARALGRGEEHLGG